MNKQSSPVEIIYNWLKVNEVTDSSYKDLESVIQNAIHLEEMRNLSQQQLTNDLIDALNRIIMHPYGAKEIAIAELHKAINQRNN